MNTEQNNNQQKVPADQALAMAVSRVKNAEAELQAATSNLYALNEQVIAQMVQAESNAMKDKIEELENATSEKPEKVAK